MATISIDQFRASGIDCDDIGSKIPGQDLDGCVGRVYLDTLHIENWKDDRHGKGPPDGPTWLLTLGNQQHVGDLALMELELYRWALSDGHLITGDRPTGLQHEFRDFSPFDIPLPLLDTNWTDYSWHQDAMPLFVHEPSGVAVWVNYDEQDKRETPERFTAITMEWDRSTRSWMHERRDRPVLFTTEDEDVLLSSLPNFIEPRALAHAFALGVEKHCILQDEADGVTGDKPVERWITIRQRNATAAYAGRCATYEMLDADMIMADTFVKTTGRHFLLTDADATSEDARLWIMAWEIAKDERLTAN